MFVVFHTESLRHEKFETMGAAKRSCTAQNKKFNRQNAKRAARYNEPVPAETNPYAWTDFENFDLNINTMTTTYNMLDPDRKPIPIRKADLGGCCDPATERYHCM